MKSSKKFPWILAGLGCGVLVITTLAVVGFWGVSKARQLAAEMTDPEKRTEKTAEMLGVDKIPEGYQAMMAMDVPFIMEVAILSDLPPGDDGMISGFGERGFIYVKFARFGPNQADLKDYFEGRTSDPHTLTSNSIHLETQETIGRGRISRNDGDLLYVSQRGSAGTREHIGEGITSLVLFDCPDDTRSHFAIWFAPDPSPETALADLDLSGTPADEAALATFMSPFTFCSS